MHSLQRKYISKKARLPNKSLSHDDCTHFSLRPRNEAGRCSIHYCPDAAAVQCQNCDSVWQMTELTPPEQ